MTVVARRTGEALAAAGVADRPTRRMVGLLRHARLDPGDGLVIVPCNMVHTWFMRFAIDVLFLDAAGVVLKAVSTMRPFQLAWGGWKAKTTVELPAGTLVRSGIGPGDVIGIEPA